MIVLDDLSVGYHGEAILEHMDVTFSDGVIYGILAKSGTGKTTLLKTIAGLLRPVCGNVTKMVAEPGYPDAYLNRRTDVFFKIIEE